MKFEPTTLNVKPASPIPPLLGEIAAIVGAGFRVTVTFADPDFDGS
jgi:hypothetical protein